jgi:hypothetical protein
VHPNELLVGRLFSALEPGDFRTAGDCYLDHAEYRDPAFQLKGKSDITAMWHMVCSRNVKVSFRDIHADERTGTAHWEALYIFSKTHRLVHNKIDARFTFHGGKILLHQDEWDRWTWTVQALGRLAAIAITALPFLLRWQATTELKRFKEKRPNAPAAGPGS